MERQQFNALMKGLKSAYPNFSFVDTKEGLEMWYTMLKDIDYPLLSLAVQTHISTSKYPPSIAEIRELATTNLDERDWSEGWDLVMRAIRNYGAWRIDEALEFISSQDSLAGDIAKRLSFSEICLSENLANDRANFRMAYEKEKKHRKRYQAIPSSVKMTLEELKDNQNKLNALMTGAMGIEK